MTSKDREDLESARKQYNTYLRFSALGFQMIGMVLAGVLGGNWLDGRITLGFPLFTLVGSLLGITGAMVFLFKETRSK
ncbi:MAG: AtpZ/AtpI family protein [Flavobacteriales bacterium]|nr:AtpZ/AtpI family protein [Flavobacteriales bacterium]